jgi:predicted phosphohydrolase
MLRLVCTSDLHSQQNQVKIPDGDVFIFAGDAAGQGGQSEFRRFCEWVQHLPHRYKLIIAGNHDGVIERLGKQATRELLTADGRHREVVYLEDDWYKIQDLTIWGAPWTPRFFNWSFMETRGDKMMQKWDQMPDHVDVLITHGPAFGHLDTSGYGGGRAGCEALAQRLEQVQPRLHIFGHIHGNYGWKEHRWPEGKVTCFANVSCCNERYEPVNPPVVLDWDGQVFVPA